MSWNLLPVTPYPIAMNQPQGSQHHIPSPQQRLMEWINGLPAHDSNQRWEGIRTSTFTPDELSYATNEALRLYLEWYAEDMQRLWRLLKSSVGERAFDAMQAAGSTLQQLVEHRHRRNLYQLLLIHQLVEARWETRFTTLRLDQAAAAAAAG